MALDVPYRERQAPAEAVVRAALSFDQQSGAQQLTLAEAQLRQVFLCRVPFVERKAELEGLYRFAIEAASLEVVARFAAGVPGEQLVIPVGGCIVRGVQPLAGLFLLRRRAPLLQLYAGLFGKHAQRFGELDAFSLHHEGDDITAGAAGAEAVPALPFRRDDERGRVLSVERAGRLERASGLL